MQTFTVRQPAPLFEYLLTALAGIKRNRLKKYLAQGLIFVNAKAVTRHDYPLQAGDKIEIEREHAQAKAKKIQNQLDILYEDKSVLAINKPQGLLTIATDKIRENTAYYRVHAYLKSAIHAETGRTPPKPVFIVHRLDRDTSGVLLFAKTLESKLWLQENWARFAKKYYAVVHGIPAQNTGTITSYLKENQMLRVFATQRASPDAKYAITHYRVLFSDKGRTLLEVTLETGRKHQIRVHLAEIGHPVLGDEYYGTRQKNPEEKRLALHAFSLDFLHPVTHKKICLTAPVPSFFQNLISFPSGFSGSAPASNPVKKKL